MNRLVLGVIWLWAFATICVADEPAKFAFHQGDHVSLIGNTMADRLQHDGLFEAVFQTQFRDHKLSFRNLGFSADELNMRLRSQNFGSPDEWLTRTQTDVVLAFFGYNESWKGEAGLEGFQRELDGFVKHTLGQKYNGESAPRLVLVTPARIADQYEHPVFGTTKATAIEVARNAEINSRIAAYAKAMVEVAAANGISVVDLSRKPLSSTIDGLHSVGSSHHWLAVDIISTLYPDRAAALNNPGKPLDSKLVEAITDKDFHWFNRYRVTDGFSVFGGRSTLVFEPEKQTNLVVAQREMAILDQMTGYRDERVWSIAQGKGDIAVDDSRTEPFIPVISNKPGPGPNGEHVFLDGGDEAISKMTMHPGMEIKLFASEKQFPELINPVQMATDMKGRVWVACWPMYTHWRPKDPVNDSLLILEDTDKDGVADKCITFAGDLHNPTGFEFYGGGVLVANTPDLLFLKDTDGDDKADVRVRVLNGLDSADTHHAANSFALDPGGALYFQEGTFHQTQVESTWGPPSRCSNGGVFRYEPRTQKFSVYVTHGFANPHGHVWDRWGNDIVHDGTGSQPYPGWLFSGHMNYPQKHATPPQIYQQRTRPTSGTEILSSEHFPPDVQGNLLVANVIGFQGILQYQLREDGGTIVGTEVEPIVTSTDPNFRPTDLEVAGDGALYFGDWQNPIIGHMQHNLRDPNRDRTHGRVYRVTASGKPLLKSDDLTKKSVADLVKLLESPYDRVRYRAKIELSGRKTDEVIAAVYAWVKTLNADDADYEHHMLEALWVHQSHDVVNDGLLKRMLSSKDHRARAAAGRVLCYWRDRIPETLDLIRIAAADPHPRVRAEAVRTASFLAVPEAVEVVVVAREQEMDRAVEYLAAETMKTLDPIWKSAIDAKTPITMRTPAGVRYLFQTMSTDELVRLEGELAHAEASESNTARYRMVAQDLLLRTGVRDELRESVLRSLAAANKVSASELLVQQLLGLDATSSGSETIAFDLLRVLTRLSDEEQKQAGPLLVKMATESKQPITRQLGYVAKIAADDSVDPSWELASKSAKSLRDLVNAMPMVRDPSVRAALYPKVEPLLDGLPESLRSGNTNTKGSFGRYVRVELQGRRPLTLAEVEVYSDGTNVARRGKATQSKTSHGGNAQRAIDGNTNPIYSAGGQTHTPEDGQDPWWEVDLGAEYPVERVSIFNRTEGFENRLDGFTLKVLDANREEVQVLRGLPGPRPKADFDMSAGNPELLIRRSAMLALTTVRGQEANTFNKLVKFALAGTDRPVAIDAIQRLPKSEWATDQAQPLLDSVIAYLAPLPPAERTSPAALSAIQFGYELTSLLPADQGKAMRAKLGEIGVRIIRVGTVPDQMLYDKERLVVQAGKPVEFLFENTDIMPHNFVIIQPGSLEEVGLAAEAQATQPGALERHYVPTSSKVLLSSTLLQPRNVQKLSFNVPKEPGVYPYVCTYPGHWRRMFGALYVVADMDAYEADPEAYLAKNAVAAQDPLLKFNRPRKAWTIEELTPLLDEVAHGGRNFGNGKQIFAATNCIACHKLNGVGQEVGQDLAKLDAKQQPVDILKSILDPSANINEKFQSYIIETKEGKVHTGLILEETGDAIKLLENPLAKTAAVTIEKSNIETRTKSPTSIMPKGLLDKLTREEILDLLAYVIARGDQKNAVFGTAHNHEHHHDH